MLNRPPRRPRRTAPALVPALAAAALLTTAGCSAGAGGAGAADGAAGSASPLAVRAASPSPSLTVAPTLTEAQARSALIGPADLGADWTPTGGAATWRDALLKGKADLPDCRRLLDGLYTENLLGEPAGARSVAGFDDTGGGAQLRYQVGAYDRAVLDDALAWLKKVPDTCGEFTATDARGGQLTVRAAAASLPGLGEAREGLRVTVSGDGGAWPAVLTLDFAAVRVGDSALSLTHGGLDDLDTDDTREAVEAGTRRLAEVLAGRTPAASDGTAAAAEETAAAVRPPEGPEEQPAREPQEPQEAQEQEGEDGEQEEQEGQESQEEWD